MVHKNSKPDCYSSGVLLIIIVVMMMFFEMLLEVFLHFLVVLPLLLHMLVIMFIVSWMIARTVLLLVPRVLHKENRTFAGTVSSTILPPRLPLKIRHPQINLSLIHI